MAPQHQASAAHTCDPSSVEAEIERIEIQSQFLRPYLENTQHKKGLSEWLK
jgi:hypothetical protein